MLSTDLLTMLSTALACLLYFSHGSVHKTCIEEQAFNIDNTIIM